MIDRANLPPRPALVLGAAGLLPTVAALLVMLFAGRAYQDIAFRAAGTYGAVILSFLGGAWWGLAAARGHKRDLMFWLGLAVLPALAAWGVVFALSPRSVAVLSGLFLLCLWTDRELTRRFVAPEWWLAMRLPLSLCMAGLHMIIAVVRFVRT
jgi:hypothetical protein